MAQTSSGNSEQLIPAEMIEQAMALAIDGGIALLTAIVTLIIGFWVAGRVGKSIGRLLDSRDGIDQTLKPVLVGIARYTIIIATMVAVLSQFGIEIASIIAVLGAIGLAVGLALQGTLSNVASGVMLLSLRHFKVGDVVNVSGLTGAVVEIGIFSTQLKTADGVFIMVPNSNIWGAAITNFSRNDTRRVDVLASISYDDDIEKAMALLTGIISSDDRYLKEPGPVVFVAAMAASSIDIQMRGWVDNGDYWAVLWDTTKRVKVDLEAAGFSIPYPQQDVHIHTLPAGGETITPAK